jgi:xanthine dehydrogenase accessory factor
VRDLAATIERWWRDGETVALATLVAVHGSAPRLPGAMLAVTRGGRLAGSVSGGCVESDVIRRAREVLDGSRGADVATYGIATETGLEVGLSCGGEIDVLIEPLVAGEAWQSLFRAFAEGRPTAVAVAIEPAVLRGRRLFVIGESHGAAHATAGPCDASRGGDRDEPQTIDSIAATSEGERSERPGGDRNRTEVVGSISAAIDGEVSERARALLRDGGSTLMSLPSEGADASVFVAGFPRAATLFIVGATHTAEPLCRMAKELGFDVTIVDPRSAFASAERFPAADRIVVEWPQRAFSELGLDESSYVVTLTHDPRFDLPALRAALRAQVRYVGAMGGRTTHAKRRGKLEAEGFDTDALDRIHGPIGLDVGARTPQETAVAIIAEMLAVRAGRDGKPLTQGRGPIHAAR